VDQGPAEIIFGRIAENARSLTEAWERLLATAPPQVAKVMPSFEKVFYLGAATAIAIVDNGKRDAAYDSVQRYIRAMDKAQ
jgi:hypothetical protein